MTTLIPRSSASRREPSYARLLSRVHPERRTALAFEGILLKPGARVDISDLWPSEQFPAKPLLLEFAGSDLTGHGHNRSRYLHVLWRFDPEKNEWVEIARTLSQGAEWVQHMAALALAELGTPPPADSQTATTVSQHFVSHLDEQLGQMAAADRSLALTMIYEQVASRLAAAEI